MLWVEKYRPKTFEEIVGNEEIVERLKQMVREKGDIPHLLLVGRPGVGKTTLAYVIKNELGISNQDFLELNASDERGIDTIRQKVKLFAKSSPSSKFKLLLLDEADYLTPEAQHSLRRIMEKYGENCRFILTANYESQIIQPLKSRCATFTLLPVMGEEVVRILSKIARSEKVVVDKEALMEIARVSKGDLRSAINLLQTLSSSQPITKDKVATKVGDISTLITYLKTSPKLAIGEAEKLLKVMSEKELLLQLFHHFQQLYLNSSLPKQTAKQIFTLIAEADYRMAVGADSYIQLINLIYQLSNLFMEEGENTKKEGDGNESGAVFW